MSATEHPGIPKKQTERINATSGIILDGVSKDYGRDQPAVKPLDLKIERGEFFSLLGSSGSGKTTTLKMISGLEFPTTGRITLEGVDITSMPANRRDVHTVFQNYALFPHLNVAANVAYGLQGRKMPREEIARRVAEMLELVEMTGHEKDAPEALSGGQQQRIALARALVLEPQALLLDEPLGALDLKLRHHMQEVLRDIHQKVGITFVYVTHDQEEAFSMSDRVAVMSQGSLMQVSTPEELYLHPVDGFVADFVGASNMLDGTVETVRETGLYQVRLHQLERTAVIPGVEGLVCGQRTSLILRPQNISVGERSGGDDVIHLEMDVSDRMFLGSYTRLSLTTGGLALVANLSQRGGALLQASHASASWDASDMWAVPA